MTDLNAKLSEIRERCERATPGLLHVGHIDESERYADLDNVNLDTVLRVFFRSDESFYCHARIDIPKLLAVIEKLRERLEQWRQYGAGLTDQERITEEDAELAKILEGESDG